MRKIICQGLISPYEIHLVRMISIIDLFRAYIIIQYMLNYYPLLNDDNKSIALKELAERFKVLTEPNRLLILNLLMEGVQCNCELGDALQMAPNLISHHLSILRKSGLVEAERDAQDSRWVYYSINAAVLDELISSFQALFDPSRIKPRRPTCGPKRLDETTTKETK